MSSISPVSVPTTRLPAEVDVAQRTAQPQAAPAFDATALAPIEIGDLISALGLAGLRPPLSAAASSVALAEIALALELTTGDARGRRAALQAAAASGAAGTLNPAAAFARAEANQALVATKRTELVGKQTELAAAQAKAAELDGRIAAQAGAVDAAEKAVAAATTEDGRKSAQAQLDAARGTLAGLQTERGAIAATLGELTVAVAALTAAIGALTKAIQADLAMGTQLTVFAQILAVATSSNVRTREQVQALGAAGDAVRLDSLFESISRRIAESQSAARAPADAGEIRSDDAPPPEPTPRAKILAEALRDAISSLVDALAAVDPDAVARPPAQTGRSRLRLEA